LSENRRSWLAERECARKTEPVDVGHAAQSQPCAASHVDGNPAIADAMQVWLDLSTFTSASRSVA
jgi:hypothetical protein